MHYTMQQLLIIILFGLTQDNPILMTVCAHAKTCDMTCMSSIHMHWARIKWVNLYKKNTCMHIFICTHVHACTSAYGPMDPEWWPTCPIHVYMWTRYNQERVTMVCMDQASSSPSSLTSPSLSPFLLLTFISSSWLPPTLRYGVGYRLVVVKEPSCDSSQVTGIVTSLVKGSKNVTDVGTELSYILPSHSSQSFPQLFDSLDGQYRHKITTFFLLSVALFELKWKWKSVNSDMASIALTAQNSQFCVAETVCSATCTCTCSYFDSIVICEIQMHNVHAAISNSWIYWSCTVG